MEIATDINLPYVDDSMAIKGIYYKEDGVMRSIEELVHKYSLRENIFIERLM